MTQSRTVASVEPDSRTKPRPLPATVHCETTNRGAPRARLGAALAQRLAPLVELLAAGALLNS